MLAFDELERGRVDLGRGHRGSSVGAVGVEQSLDERGPLIGLGLGELQRLDHERAERDGQAEAGEDVGVDRRVDGRGRTSRARRARQVGRGVDRAGRSGDRRVPGRVPTATTASSSNGRSFSRNAMREPSAASRSRGGRARGGLHQRLDLGRGAVRDRGEQELALVAEVRVDRAGGEPRGAGDVLHSGLLVALLHEDLDGGRDQSVTGARLGRHCGHGDHDNGYYPTGQGRRQPCPGGLGARRIGAMAVPLPDASTVDLVPPDEVETELMARACATAAAGAGGLTEVQRAVVNATVEAMTGFVVDVAALPPLGPEEFAQRDAPSRSCGSASAWCRSCCSSSCCSFHCRRRSRSRSRSTRALLESRTTCSG